MNKLRESEKQNKDFENIEVLPMVDILSLINNQDQTIANIVKESIPAIESLALKGLETLNKKGRIIYLGSGASADIASSDAQEMNGTYGVPFDTFRSIHLQLGPNLNWQKLEGFTFKSRQISEDFHGQMIEDLKSINFTNKDLIIGISASGETAAIIKALEWSKSKGATVACIVMNENSTMEKDVDLKIVVKTGNEVIPGSTRMKCGTATKMVLNMLSTSIMIKGNNVYKGLMVGVLIPPEGNLKLRNRAAGIIAKLADINIEKAHILLKDSEDNVKLSLVRGIKKVTLNEAKELLLKNNNDLRKILG